MNQDTPTWREIEELEAWFRTRFADAATPDAEAIRTAVRCALDEQWLRRQLRDDPPSKLDADIKTRMRKQFEREQPLAPRLSAVRGEKAGNRSRRFFLLGWSAGISAAAAVLALWLAWPTPLPTPPQISADSNAYFAYSVDDMDSALAELGEDIALLEHGWSRMRAASDGWYEEWIDRVDRIGDQL